MRKDLRELPADPLKFKGYLVAEASPEDMAAIQKHPETKDPEAYEKRLKAGHTCYCTKKGDEIVATGWASADRCSLFFGSKDEIVFMPLDKESAYSYDIITTSRYRMLGIGYKSFNHVMHSLRGKGYRYQYAVVDPRNRASARLHLAFGFKPVKFLHVIRLGGLRKCLVTGTIKESHLPYLVPELQKR
ncbi:MAG: GNAT family N-acetyltransferase [Candidatus Omnitrophota bacterium]